MNNHEFVIREIFPRSSIELGMSNMLSNYNQVGSFINLQKSQEAVIGEEDPEYQQFVERVRRTKFLLLERNRGRWKVKFSIRWKCNVE